MTRGLKAHLACTTALSSPQMEFGKKGGKGGVLGLVVGAVAAIAVPFIAAPIATAIFGGSSIIGSAIVGAGLGALGGAGAAKLSGGDVMRGALFGAAGGAIGSGVSAAASGAGWTASAARAADPWAGLRTVTGAGVAGGAAGAGSVAGLQTGVSSSAAPLGTAAAGVSTAGAGVAGTGGRVLSQLTQGLLNAAPQLIAQTVTQMSAPDQAEYLATLEQEMEDFKGRDETQYAARLNLYNQFLAQARNVNPLLDAQLAEARVKRQQSAQYQQLSSDLALTDRGPGSREVMNRKFAVEAPLNQFAAFADAYQRGNERQNSAFSTAAGLYPENFDSGLKMAGTMYEIAGRERDRVAEGAGQMAGLLLSPFQSRYRRQDENSLYSIV